MRIHGALVHYTGRGLDIAAPSGSDLVNTLVWVGKTYPISGFNYNACDVITFNGDLTVAGGGGCGSGWNQLFNTLANMRSASHSTDVYVGLLPTGVPTSGVIGCGGGGVAISYLGSGSVLAQEIGHAFGRAHAPCGNPGGPDPSYPTYGSYPSGSIGEFGFDTSSSQVFNPSSTYDFMSYCGPVWVSPHTYVGLKNGIIASPAMAHPDRAGSRQLGPGDYLYLNFRIGKDGQVDLLPSFHLHGLPVDATWSFGESRVSCRLMDDQDRVLLEHHCDINNPHQYADDYYLELHEVIAWHPVATKIAFFRNGVANQPIPIEAEPPAVELVEVHRTKRDADLARVQWRGSHPQKALTYALRYSNDGGTSWRAVAADLAESSFVVNLDLLPGGNDCIFEVIASSGIRTSTARSERLDVARKPGAARILRPAPGSRFSHGEPVEFVGGAFSPDFGTSEFDEVLWTSNLDGVIGSVSSS